MPTRRKTTPRKRPRQERARATVEALLEATAHILVAEGYDALSTNRVAQRAGASIGSIYQYFPNKEALVAALIDVHLDRYRAILAGELMAAGRLPLEAGVRQFVRGMVAAHRVNPALHRVLVEQLPRTGRLTRIREFDREIESILRSGLEARRAEVRPRNLELATFLLCRAVKGIIQDLMAERPETLADEELIGEIQHLVIAYLRPVL